MRIYSAHRQPHDGRLARPPAPAPLRLECLAGTASIGLTGDAAAILFADAARELLCPMRGTSSRVLAPAVEASILPVPEVVGCSSAVAPAAFRALTQSSRKLLRHGCPPCGTTKTCPSRPGAVKRSR